MKQEQQNKHKDLEAQVIDCPLIKEDNKCRLSNVECIYYDPKLKGMGCWFYMVNQLSERDYRF